MKLLLTLIPYLIAFLTGVLVTLLIIMISDQLDLKRESKNTKLF